MTNKLYQTQQYLKQCTAVVTAAEGNIVTLDRTIFAPEAGGQASDIGTIQGVPMVHCIDRDGEILHELAEPLKGVKPGDEVELELDWMVRLDHMQNHCGEHILSGILFTEHGIENKGFHLGSEISTLDAARRMVRAGNYEGLKMIYGNVPDTLSQLIRTAFIPSDGRHFVVADFSAIEARMIAWMAGEQWVMDVFANGQDIYCETASAMFGVPVGKHGPNADLRQKGKIATLALGYQGGPAAMIAMGALRMGIPEEELPDIVTKWRQSHPKTVAMWYEIGDAAYNCVATGTYQILPIAGGKSRLTFRMENDLIYGQSFLTIELPVGRKLYYPKPYLKENQFGKPAVHYYGVKQTTGKWGPESTYGGKLTENCVQAIARDCLCEVIRRVYVAGWDLVFHVHDEVIVDAPLDVHTEDLCALMDAPIDWAPGLLLKGAGFEAGYYMKD